MVDSIVEALLSEVLHACPADRDYRLAELKGDLLPEPLARYAADLLRAAAGRELAAYRPANLRWITEDEDAWSIYDRFVAASVSNAVAAAGEWESLLEGAVRRAVDHVLQPRTGLVTTVFADGAGALDQDTIAERVGGYHVGLPFRAAVVRALKKSPSPQLDAAGFRSIVNRVHDALTLDYTRSDWQKDLEPLRSILSLAGLPTELTVDAAIHLAGELGNPEAARTLRERSSTAVTLDDLVDAIAGPEPDESPAEAEQDLQVGADASADKPATPERIGPVPLWQRFQRNLNEPIGTSGRTEPTAKHRTPAEAPPRAALRPQTEPAVDEPPPADEEESQRPLWQKYRSSRAPASDEGQPATEIETFILGREGVRGRDSFIAELFDGDQDCYMDVLDQLRHSRSWPEASRVIAESVFKRFQVNIYSEEAVAFTNAVEARFRLQESRD